MPRDKFTIGRYWLDTVSGSANFYRCWYDAGTHTVSRRSLKTGDLEEAKIRLAAIVLTEGAAAPSDPGQVTLIAVLTRYYAEHSDRRPNPALARRAGDMLLEFLGNNAATVDTLTRAKQREFVQHLHQQGLGVAYIARLLAVVSAALNRAANEDETGLLLRAPKVVHSTAKVAEMLNVAEPVPDNWHPTIEQIAAFMDAATNQSVLRCAVLTLAFAGRPDAVRELSAGQFDARHSLISFNREGRRQTKKYRPTLPVPDRLMPYLGDWLTHEIGEVRKPWADTVAKAGLPAKFRPKALRHFMATEMRRRGVAKEQREEWMGHRRHATNDGYGHFSPDFLQEAKACANAVLGELETLCKQSIYRQVTGKSGLERFDPIAEIPQGATYSRNDDEQEVA